MNEPTVKNARIQSSALETIVSFVDSLNSGTLYTFLGVPFLQQFLTELTKTITFPIIICMSILQAMLAWRRVQLDQGKKSTVLHAIIETITAIAMTTAVAGTLLASAALTTATPMIFAAIGITKAIYNTTASIYYARQARIYNHPLKSAEEINKKRDDYFELAKKHAIGAVACVVASTVSVGLFILGEIAFAGVGLGLAITGIALAIYKGYTTYVASQKLSDIPVTKQNQEMTQNTSSMLIAKKLPFNKRNDQQHNINATPNTVKPKQLIRRHEPKPSPTLSQQSFCFK